VNRILDKLGGGDLRSEGRAEDVAAEVSANPALLDLLAQGLATDDKLIRARTCMALEVISRSTPDLLVDLLPALVELGTREPVAQARWHVAEVLGNVPPDGENREQAVGFLLDYLDDTSKIVRYCAIQTLGILGGDSPRRAEILARMGEQEDVSKGLAKAVRGARTALGEE